MKHVYHVMDIMDILEISRSQAYSFVRSVYETQVPFPVLKIGKSYRIPKEPFDAWISGKFSCEEKRN